MSNADFPPHPIANLFPMISGPELADLAKDIRENGLLEPVVLHEAKILDGRNRYAACEIAGVSPRFIHWNGQGGTPLRFVLSHNLHRRHLTTSQRAAIAVESLPMFEEEARRRQAHGSTAPGQTLSADRQQAFKASEEAAAMMNVGARTVSRAKQVKEVAPEEFEKVKAGEKTVEAAHKDAGLGGSGKVHIPPVEPTARDNVRANAAKNRLVTALSGISGFCRGLQEIDMQKAVAACTAEEVNTWATMAGDCARTLKSLRSNLNGSVTHE